MALYHLELRHPTGVTRVVAGDGAFEAAADALAAWLDDRSDP